jgi:hypothetical protein
MRIKILSRLSVYTIVTALSVAVLAQQPSPSVPSLDRLREHIEYLASDTLEGRRTGTPGANDAAHYIAGEFNRYGLRPGIQTARPARTRGENLAHYLQPFPFVNSVSLGKNNLFFVNPGLADDTAQFRVGEDWMPLGFSSNGNVESEAAVFAGFGISSAELKYDDYAVSNARDKVAIVFEGTPDGDNPHGDFARAGEVRFKVAAARAAGVKALAIIASEEKLNDDHLSRLAYDNNGEAGIPVVVVSRRLGARILNGDPAEYEKLADSRKRLAERARRRGDQGMPAGPERLSLSINIIRHESPSFNVIGILPGSDLKDETIVIGAHYDHLGRGGEGSLAPREGDIHHGADDNASGVAGLIELARMLSSQSPKPRRTIVFIAFSGEEEGLIGSNYYVNHPIVPLANTVAMINMDMIGRLRDKKLIIGGVGTALEWRDVLDRANPPVGMTATMRRPAATDVEPSGGSANVFKEFDLTLNEDGYGPSDHSSFYAKQIPVLFFWTGNHEDYHKPSDTADKINYQGEAQVVALVGKVIREIDGSDKRPTYTVAKSDSQGRTMGFRVYLGTIPNYADSNDGLKLDGVRDDSPAAKAGLKAGDKIVKMAGREVKNVYDYTYALGEMKAGQEYEVEILRGSERLRLKITPAVRK